MQNQTPEMIHKIDGDLSNTNPANPKPIFIITVAVMLFAGILTGFLLSKLNQNTQSSGGTNSTMNVPKTAGTLNKEIFKDKAEGLLKEGGIDGEGNFHLERPGGLSQNVYLTSSTIDLAGYIGKKVRVWGATFKGQLAGWLMDVGYIEVL